jgi:PKD repeat protein
MTITPGDIAPTSGTFHFEVLASGAFEPGTFVIGGKTYSLVVNSNSPPACDAGGPYNVNEGESVVLTSTGDDPGDTLTYAWDLNNDGIFETPGQSLTFSAAALDGPDTLPVSVQVTDSGGLTAVDQTAINVVNVLPVIGVITGAESPLELGLSADLTAGFTDQGVLDTHAAAWNWGDGSQTAVENATSPVSGTHTYSAPGVYTVELRVTDDDGASDTSVFQYVVVYDPDGGFVTGGGWIYSGSGWYMLDPSLEGKANFGFVSKYKKGSTIPTGKTEFNFRAGSLNFHSDEYEWLVINQNNTNAQYKGSGTINGDSAPNGELYRFMLWAADVDTGDTFRIRIWYEETQEEVVYDNGSHEPIDGGNIKIHGGESAAPAKPSEFALMQNYPNSFNPDTWIPYSLAEGVGVVIRIYDVSGRIVRKLDLGHKAAGFYTSKSESAYWDGKNEAGETVSSGIYFYSITAGDFCAMRKMTVRK